MDTSTVDRNSKNEVDFTKCRVVEIANGKIVECHVEQPMCSYILHFGSSIFCQHPMRKENVKLNRI
jgi:hypothetical protein